MVGIGVEAMGIFMSWWFDGHISVAKGGLDCKGDRFIQRATPPVVAIIVIINVKWSACVPAVTKFSTAVSSLLVLFLSHVVEFESSSFLYVQTTLA